VDKKSKPKQFQAKEVVPPIFELMESMRRFSQEEIISRKLYYCFLDLVDPLSMARLIANHAKDKQEKIEMWENITKVTREKEDLEQVITIWEQDFSGDSPAHEEITLALFKTYLALGKIEEVNNLTHHLTTNAEYIKSLLWLFQRTNNRGYLHAAKAIVDDEPDREEKASQLYSIAYRTEEKEHILLAINTIQEVLVDCQNKKRLSGFHLFNVKLFLKLKKYPEARESASMILIPKLRIEARAVIAETTKDEDDFALMILDFQNSEIHRVTVLQKVIEICLKRGREDLARRYARMREHPAEQCLLFGVISGSDKGAETDLQETWRMYHNMLARSEHDPRESPAILKMVEILAKKGQYASAKNIAWLIEDLRSKCLAYLTIFQNYTKKEK